jgi:two-component system cell cycle response regulator DivK
MLEELVELMISPDTPNVLNRHWEDNQQQHSGQIWPRLTQCEKEVSDSMVASLLDAQVPIRILLVEDNPISRQLMGDYLEYQGFSVLGLGEGSSFMATVTEFRPHLILLDLKLPDVDGYTLLEQLRSRLEWETLPVIVVSAYAFQTDQQRAFSLGVRQYLIKPVNLSQLKQAITQEFENYSLV